MGRATSFFDPRPWGRGQKVKYHLVNSKDFFTNLMFSQMKDTKHIKRDFRSVAWGMPQGWDFGALGVPRGSKKYFQTWSCGISN